MRQTTTDRPAKKSPIEPDREDREAIAGDDDIMDDELDELEDDEDLEDAAAEEDEM
jgi:hypothetical protein